jgi:hypothetical protein
MFLYLKILSCSFRVHATFIIDAINIGTQPIYAIRKDISRKGLLLPYVFVSTLGLITSILTLKTTKINVDS